MKRTGRRMFIIIYLTVCPSVACNYVPGPNFVLLLYLYQQFQYGIHVP